MGTLLSTRKETASATAVQRLVASAERERGSADHTLERIGSRIVLYRNRPLFREGDRADAIYRVVSGAIRTSRLMPDGRRYVADFLFPGDFIGLNDRQLRVVTAETLCDAILIRYPRRQFEMALDSDSSLEHTILKVLSGGVASAYDRMLLLGRKTAAERLASFLLAMADRTGSDAIELPMTRADIADYLGLTIETISRTISLFTVKRIVRRLSANNILIQNHEALEDLAESC